ncbi:MAG: helix-turn-helix domain-containing protein [Pseudonocardiaceae bacterium]
MIVSANRICAAWPLRYCAGTTARQLAEQFNISKSSVKRLVRELRRTPTA